MASAMRAFAAPPNAPRAQDDKLVDHQAFRLRVEAAKMEVAARRHSTTAIPEHAVRDSYRRRTKSVFERHRSNSITEDLVGGDSRCPLECEHQRILSGERSEQNLTTTCFLAWAASVLILAGSHVMPVSWDLLVPATTVVVLLGFAYAFLYKSNRRTNSNPELLEPLRRRPSSLNPDAPTTPVSPAHPTTTAAFDVFAEHEPPTTYEDYIALRKKNTTRHAPSAAAAAWRTPKDVASRTAPNLEIFLSTTCCD